MLTFISKAKLNTIHYLSLKILGGCIVLIRCPKHECLSIFLVNGEYTNNFSKMTETVSIKKQGKMWAELDGERMHICKC